MIDRFMQNQLDGNLALRGLFEPGYANLGTAWSGQYVNLDYMTQMGGVALLDYAYRFRTGRIGILIMDIILCWLRGH